MVANSKSADPLRLEAMHYSVPVVAALVCSLVGVLGMELTQPKTGGPIH